MLRELKFSSLAVARNVAWTRRPNNLAGRELPDLLKDSRVSRIAIVSSSLHQATATIDRDLPCDGCAYNLRTLTTDARCPECGLPVELTLAAAKDDLRSEHLDGACWLACLLILECLAAIAAGAMLLISSWQNDLIGVSMLIFTWVLAIATFAEIAWLHRHRQQVYYRWHWFPRHIGVVVCACALAATLTRVMFASTLRPLMSLVFVGMLPIVVSPIPAMSLLHICRRAGMARIARTNMVVSLASAAVAVWLGFEVFYELGRWTELRMLAALPAPGVDYATLFSVAGELAYQRASVFAAILVIALRLCWLSVMVIIASRLAQALSRRRWAPVDAGEKIAASSGP